MTNKYPRVTVGALIFDDQGKFLLVKSHKWGGRWLIPSGHVEFGEKLEDALVREIKEEVNLEISDIEFYFFGELINSQEYHKANTHFICFDFLAKKKSGQLKLNDEAEEFAWVDLEQARDFNLEYLTRRSLTRYKNYYVASHQ
ncbi:NUDIX domain-containing protein [Patescibacteria group bacterium]|nr:NUDIX domain-containing protein [Patescibacteria group bacterium]